MGVLSKANLIQERGLHKEWGFAHDSVGIYSARCLFEALEVPWHTQQARYFRCRDKSQTRADTWPHRCGIPRKGEYGGGS